MCKPGVYDFIFIFRLKKPFLCRKFATLFKSFVTVTRHFTLSPGPQ